MNNSFEEDSNYNNKNNSIYNDSFTEVGSVSDLKSVPSATIIASAYNSLANSESEHEPEKKLKWPKYKRYRDSFTGEEVVYELVQSNPTNHKGLLTVCSELVTLSSISLFVASNLFAFTVGMLVGKRIAYDFDF